MKQVLTLSLTAVVLFGLSAAASWKWRHMHMPPVDQSSGSAGNSNAAEGSDGSAEGSSTGRATATTNDQTASSPATRKPVTQENSELRVAVRPAYTPGVDETVQLAASLRNRLAAVREREAQLATRQQQLELVYEDIRAERQAIDELRKQVSEELKVLEEQMTAAERQHAEIEVKQQGLEVRVTELESDERNNIKKMAGVYDSMSPESAAKILQQMSDNGSMDTAVKLLGLMKERQAAKVLAELPDPALAAQLSEKLKGLKRTTAATISK